MMDAVKTSESSLSFYKATGHNIPKTVVLKISDDLGFLSVDMGITLVWILCYRNEVERSEIIQDRVL
jgi:hypothetical protein